MTADAKGFSDAIRRKLRETLKGAASRREGTTAAGEGLRLMAVVEYVFRADAELLVHLTKFRQTWNGKALVIEWALGDDKFEMIYTAKAAT